MTIRLQHEWTPEHIATAVELWTRLVNVYSVNAYEHVPCGGSHYTRHVAEKDITEEWITALVISDGEPVELAGTGTWSAVELSLISYSDHGGSDCDAANVRALADHPAVTVSTDGRYDEGSATVMLGEMPAGDDVATGLGRVRDLVEKMEYLQQHALLDDDVYSAYIEELAEEAWDEWLRGDVRAEVEQQLGELLGDKEAAWDLVEAKETAEEDPFRKAFYAYQHPSGFGWEAESATSVRHAHHDGAVRHVLVKVFGRTDVANDCEACERDEH